MPKVHMKNQGIIDLNEKAYNKYQNIPFDEIDNNKERDFKIIKTPISNRTLIIGGRNYQTIKEIFLNDIEIYKENMQNIYVIYLLFINEFE